MNAATIRRIAIKFGVNAGRFTKIRQGIYRIETTGGKRYSLKQMPMNLARLHWVDRMIRLVRKQGCRQVVWREGIGVKGRAKYVITQGATFVLMPWIHGRHPSPRSQYDMRACGAALARFHMAGRSAIKLTKSYSEIGSWMTELNRSRRQLIRYIVLSHSGHYTPAINRMLLAHEPQLLKYADDAENLLRTGPYRAYRRTSQTNAVLCHGDGGPSNFIRNREGMHLLDFETLQINLRAYDLYRLVYNSCKDYQWDFSIAKAIMEGYRREASLNRNDILLMKPWLRFPRTTSLVLGPSERFPLTKNKLLWAFASERKISRFLNQLDRYASAYLK